MVLGIPSFLPRECPFSEINSRTNGHLGSFGGGSTDIFLFRRGANGDLEKLSKSTPALLDSSGHSAKLIRRLADIQEKLHLSLLIFDSSHFYLSSSLSLFISLVLFILLFSSGLVFSFIFSSLLVHLFFSSLCFCVLCVWCGLVWCGVVAFLASNAASISISLSLSLTLSWPCHPNAKQRSADGLHAGAEGLQRLLQPKSRPVAAEPSHRGLHHCLAGCGQPS